MQSAISSPPSQSTAASAEQASKARTGPSRDAYAGSVLPGRNAENYSKGRPPYPDALIKRIGVIIREAFGEDPSVLDVACGNGRATHALREMCSRRVQGFDIDPKMLEQARKHSHADIRYHEGRVEELPKHFPSERFHVVTVCTALHYFDSPEGLSAIKSVLLPNGIVIEVRGGGPLRRRVLQEALGVTLDRDEQRKSRRDRNEHEQTQQNMEKTGFTATHNEEFPTEQVYTKDTALADLDSGTSSRVQSREGTIKAVEKYFEKNTELKVSRTYKLIVYRQNS